MRRTLPLFIFLALLLPTLAMAQPEPSSRSGRFEITPMVGYRFEGDINVNDTELFDSDLTIDEGTAYGLALDIPLGRNLQLELLANHHETSLIAEGGIFEHDTEIADLDIDYYHVGLLYQWGRGQVQPYVVGSLGLARLSVDLAGTQDEDRPSGSLGAGVKVFFGEHVGLRFEGRGYYTVLDEDDNDDDDHHGNHHDDDDRWDDEDSISQSEVTVGLIFAW